MQKQMPDSRRISNKMPLTVTLSLGMCLRGASARAPRGVFGALAAAGRGGGRHLERRKSMDTKVPIGTTESSPQFQLWVASGEWPEPRPPSRRSGAFPPSPSASARSRRSAAETEARRKGGRGDRKDGTGSVRSFVPDGTRFMFAPQPSDKSLGYFRASLRDAESRHAKHIPRPTGEGTARPVCRSFP